jgi:hypothetical protein
VSGNISRKMGTGLARKSPIKSWENVFYKHVLRAIKNQSK